ncbi:MAG: alpha/beta hydrolase [Gammaproteobacteria bacterium]|nr:alpha/beta hydrolase [Gammaproteobacteria bacterium]|tara:strand:- start:629 stop:1345 length:717 start_codon:yes stop_codon:yes gene_type:complete
MPEFKRGDVSLNYEIHGEGYPILLFAPGGMRSAIDFWKNSEWDPISTLSPHFKVIAMDQRNAGKSVAPISGSDGWSTYTSDHVALLDHLEIERCHLLGGCIGGPYCFGTIQAGPERISSAVLQQSIGSDNNQDTFYDLFNGWMNEVKPRHPSVTEAEWQQFRSNMFDGDFVYNVDRDFVRQCETPLLVLMGSDVYHPTATSREIAELAPNATLIENWKDPEADNTVNIVIDFLKANTP